MNKLQAEQQRGGGEEVGELQNLGQNPTHTAQFFLSLHKHPMAMDWVTQSQKKQRCDTARGAALASATNCAAQIAPVHVQISHVPGADCVEVAYAPCSGLREDPCSAPANAWGRWDWDEAELKRSPATRGLDRSSSAPEWHGVPRTTAAQGHREPFILHADGSSCCC